ncbi:MAG: carboxy terminal-processing peptidase [Chitinophagales bacterium]
MKFQFKIPFLALAFFMLLAFTTGSDDSQKDRILLQVILQGLNQVHYEPHELDDNFSEKVYGLYLKRLDYNKRFFTKKDIAEFDKYKDDLDNEAAKASYDFFELSTRTLNTRTTLIEGFYKEILAEPFDFSKDEYIEVDYEKMDYAKDEADLKERWRQLLKYQTLSRLSEKLKQQEEGEETLKGKSYKELEKDSREKVLENQNRLFKRIGELDQRDRLSTYLNAITSVYDPHTGYFPPKDKETFDIEMSGRLEGIGARLQEKDGLIKVSEIVPGSASWKQGELEAEDVILKVSQVNTKLAELSPLAAKMMLSYLGKDEEVDYKDKKYDKIDVNIDVDVVEMRLDDAVQLIRGKKGTNVKLTVKKADNSIKEIVITRDIVVIEESYVKSAIIEEGDAADKYGYIYLPKFYADFNSTEGRSCFQDMKKELAKMKTENVNGILLDLRNNGGGSLRDVVDMAGLFIKEGPIVQVKEKEGRAQVLRDTDPTVQYDGKLVILVNSFSASASEIMAAAMQDYGRAIIVGSSATFGKGTVQRFIDLDQSISSDFNEFKPLGSIKLTIQKFYRINGGTNQLKGVIPDVVLPDSYAYIEVGEKEQDYSMPWDEIAPADFEVFDHPVVNREEVLVNSRKRVANHPTFQLIEENAQRLKKQREESSYTLCLDKYNRQQVEIEEQSKRFEDIEKSIEGLKVESLKSDAEAMAADKDKQKTVAEWHENLGKDVYLYEALQVLKDMHEESK